jgi:hypothetical protein
MCEKLYKTAIFRAIISIQELYRQHGGEKHKNNLLGRDIQKER